MEAPYPEGKMLDVYYNSEFPDQAYLILGLDSSHFNKIFYSICYWLFLVAFILSDVNIEGFFNRFYNILFIYGILIIFVMANLVQIQIVVYIC